MKDIEWWASSYKDICELPDDVRSDIGHALRLAQKGVRADYAERMKGNLSDVVEIKVDDDRGDSTYRATYTTKIGDVVYVLDSFTQKSTKSIATPQKDLDRIEQRLKAAREHYEEQQKRKKQ